MLQLNPRLLNPDEAFINETGEIIHVSHAYKTNKGICFACIPQPGHKQTNKLESELTFLTHKYNWQEYVDCFVNNHGFLQRIKKEAV